MKATPTMIPPVCAKTPRSPRDAAVDDPHDQARLQQIHRNFEQHQQRSRHRPQPIGV